MTIDGVSVDDSVDDPDGVDDLLQPAAIRDPYPGYARLRTQPVRWNPRWRGWVVSGYPECRSVIQDSTAFSSEKLANHAGSRPAGDSPVDDYPNLGLIATWMSFVDPPDHTRLRQLVSTAFSARAVDTLRPTVLRYAEELVAGLRHDERIDLLAEFTFPFPLAVIAALLGLPTEDRELLRTWSDEIRPVVLGGSGNPDRYRAADHGLGELAAYLRIEIDSARRRPREDIISALARAGEGAGALSEDEIVGSCMVLLFGGHETSANLLANSLIALSDHPEQRSRLAREPDLIGPAVEEFLRYDGPTKGVVRWARQPAEVAGTAIMPGERLLVLLAAANRDPRVFDDPNDLRLDRAPNRHLEFGAGIHHCLGAALARAEAAIALPLLLDRFEAIEIDTADLAWEPTMLSRSLLRLPAVLRPRR